jgi:hypothetical protein
MADVARLAVRQGDALVANRYTIHSADSAGRPLDLLAVAQQKVVALRKQVTFYADEERTEEIFGFVGRERLETFTVYDITDAAGGPIGTFKMEFRRSIVRTTWTLADLGGGIEATGVERSTPVAIARRAWNLVLSDYMRAPLNFHFDFRTAGGEVVLTCTRRRRLRDIYDVELLPFAGGQRLDWRLGAAIGVALDTLEKR